MGQNNNHDCLACLQCSYYWSIQYLEVRRILIILGLVKGVMHYSLDWYSTWYDDIYRTSPAEKPGTGYYTSVLIKYCTIIIEAQS